MVSLVAPHFCRYCSAYVEQWAWGWYAPSTIGDGYRCEANTEAQYQRYELVNGDTVPYFIHVALPPPSPLAVRGELEEIERALR